MWTGRILDEARKIKKEKKEKDEQQYRYLWQNIPSEKNIRGKMAKTFEGALRKAALYV